MTDREKVLAKWPDAYAIWSKGDMKYWVFHKQHSGGSPIGIGWPIDEAWADAARRLDGN